MSTTQLSSDTTTNGSGAVAVPMRLEVVVVPVADTDRAKSFYQRLGWRLDTDVSAGDDYHVVQMTPPGSNASIIFGKGVTSDPPGSIGSRHASWAQYSKMRPSPSRRDTDSRG